MTTTVPETSPAPDRPGWREVLHDIAAGSAIRTVLAVVLSLAIASVFIVFTNEGVQSTLGYFFSRPGDFFQAAGSALGDAYAALFRGAIYNTRADSFASGIKPLTESLRFAGPLIAAGLGIALTFRSGLFNIGGQGQLLMGAIWSAWAAFQLHLPYGIHLIVAMIFGFVGAGLWAGIAGFLKAKTGAHEVIVTIMLNYIAVSLATYLMRTPVLHDMDSGSNPTTRPPDPTAVFPRLLGDGYELRWSFVLCVIAVGVFWWLMERSPLGFRLRMVGLNPDAARAAGVNVSRMTIVAMVLSGLFVGLAGINQSLGRDGNFAPQIDAGIGFDAITVALLGGSRALGVLFAGLLFGALKAAGPTMQLADVPPEILGVIQGLIVLFIAAPPLVRAIFRFLPTPREVTVVGTGRKPALEQKGGE
ncbi:ABC transporter permease [Homoserinibacter sp. GY 40078]|uniref:ABC transporter permease n=1 Tax=Homoserinibacter sp. GY 40078 TaxID=2603275 RepID=UPI0011C94D8B|nr:ABC transporter permease [Homoserinibacter sp. GY 40078]TXK18405.1 ABC transporter permease [Homoserinibacter sp. GY 40078]